MILALFMSSRVGRRSSTSAATSRARQRSLAGTTSPPQDYGRHGGRRAGAGRKPNPDPRQRRAAHRARPFHDPRRPVHIVLRVTHDVGTLRRRRAYGAIRRAAIAVVNRAGFRIVHYSLQGHHVHLLCEAADRVALANGVRAFCISAARHLNHAITRDRRLPSPRRGRVFIDRYPATPIATPTQARHCLAYVLDNWRRHRADRAPWARTARVDSYSSGAVFPGWAERDGVPFRWPAGYQPAPVRPPDTWLLRIGWRRGGPPPSLDEVPGPLR
jgi:REP element-mobilizing transposase RayT